MKLNKIKSAKLKIIFKRIYELLKISLFISMIVGINIISSKLATLALTLDYTQIRVGIFSIISVLILYMYLKSCEEIKKEK